MIARAKGVYVHAESNPIARRERGQGARKIGFISKFYIFFVAFYQSGGLDKIAVNAAIVGVNSVARKFVGALYIFGQKSLWGLNPISGVSVEGIAYLSQNGVYKRIGRFYCAHSAPEFFYRVYTV